MKEEFAVYGLPVWFMRLIGTVKVALALLILSGIWVDHVASYAAAALALLMAAAVLMHIRVKDSFKKTAPALTMLGLSLFAALV